MLPTPTLFVSKEPAKSIFYFKISMSKTFGTIFFLVSKINNIFNITTQEIEK